MKLPNFLSKILTPRTSWAKIESVKLTNQVAQTSRNEKSELLTIYPGSGLETILIMLAKDCEWDDKKIKQLSFTQILDLLSQTPLVSKYPLVDIRWMLDNLTDAGLLERERKVFFINELEKQVEEYFYKLTLNGLIFAKIIDTLSNKYPTIDYVFTLKIGKEAKDLQALLATISEPTQKASDHIAESKGDNHDDSKS